MYTLFKAAVCDSDLELTIFNTNYHHSYFLGERQRSLKEIQFQLQSSGFFCTLVYRLQTCYLSTPTPSAWPARSHNLSCIRSRRWLFSFLSLPPPRWFNQRSLTGTPALHIPTHTHSWISTNQITQKCMSRYSGSPVTGSRPTMLRASHPSSPELATSDPSGHLPPFMEKKVHLMEPVSVKETDYPSFFLKFPCLSSSFLRSQDATSPCETIRSA